MSYVIRPTEAGTGRPRRDGAAAIRRAIVMLAVLLAFACQSFVTQTHNHVLTSAAAGSTIDGGTGGQLPAARQTSIARQTSLAHQKSIAHQTSIGGQTRPDQPADCPICREYVSAGHYLLPHAIVVEPVLAGVTWLSVLPFVAWHGRARSHAWRSRGPPGTAEA